MHLNRKKDVIIKYGLSLLSILLLVIILVIRYDFYYDTNDDIMLEAILSGAYGGVPDGHGYTSQLVPIPWIIAGLYYLLPQIPWYGLILFVTQFCVLYACLVRILDYIKSVWKQVAACCVFLFFSASLLLYELVMIQYTFVSAMLLSAVIFLLITDKREEENIHQFLFHRLPYLLLFIFAAGLRKEMSLFAVPFIAAACLYKWCWDDKPTRLKFMQYMLFGISILGSIALLWGGDLLTYNTPQWKEYIKINDARTNIYDYIMVPGYEGNQEFYNSLGISKEEQLLLDNYNFSLSDKYDGATLEMIEEYQEKAFEYRYTKYYVKKIIKNVLENFDMPYRLVILLMYVLLILWFLASKKYSAVLQVFIIEVFHMLCWCYLLFYNRAPERITHGLYLWVIMMVVAIGLRHSVYVNKKVANCGMAAGVLFVMLSGVVCLNINLPKLNSEMVMIQEDDQIWNMTRTYCEENKDNLFLLDTISYAPLGAKIFGNQTELQNYTLCGGWAVKSPIYKAMLARYGVEGTIYTSISEGKQMYFISKENMKVDWLKNYFSSEGIEITVQCVDEMVTDSGTKYLVYQIN